MTTSDDRYNQLVDMFGQFEKALDQRAELRAGSERTKYAYSTGFLLSLYQLVLIKMLDNQQNDPIAILNQHIKILQSIG